LFEKLRPGGEGEKRCLITSGASLKTYEGPGITTQSEVKRSVNEGKGKLAMPMLAEPKESRIKNVWDGHRKERKKR